MSSREILRARSVLRLFFALVASASAATADLRDGLLPVFAGYMWIGGENYFAVRPRPDAPAAWVRRGELGAQVFVSSFDTEADTLRVEVRGKYFALKLPSARVLKESELTATRISAAEALKIARREVERREGWATASLVREATKQNGSFQFVAQNRYRLNSERRSIVIGSDGEVTQYRPLPPLARNSPIVFSEPFSVGVKRPFIWQKRVSGTERAGETTTPK